MSPRAETRPSEIRSTMHTTRRKFLAQSAAAGGIVWTAPVLSTIASPAAAASAAVAVVTGGAIHMIDSPAVVADLTPSNTAICGFAEQCVQLGSDLVVDADGSDGSYKGNDPAGTKTIGAGAYCSYFLRFDSASGGNSTAIGTMRVPSGSLAGLAFHTATLASTGNVLGATGTNYGTYDGFAPNDRVTVATAGGETVITVRMMANANQDDIDGIRIILAP